MNLFLEAASCISLVLLIVARSVVGLKPLTHQRRGSDNPSIISINKSAFEISVILTANL